MAWPGFFAAFHAAFGGTARLDASLMVESFAPPSGATQRTPDLLRSSLELPLQIPNSLDPVYEYLRLFIPDYLHLFTWRQLQWRNLQQKTAKLRELEEQKVQHNASVYEGLQPKSAREFGGQHQPCLRRSE
jgi:hypothetical protein